MDASLKKILLAADGSMDAILARRAAVDLARKAEAQLHVAHAWHSASSPRFETYLRPHLKREAKELLASEVERLEEEMGRTITHAHLVEGPAVDAVLDVAQDTEPDLLVLSSRGHGLIGRLVMGSISEGIVHHAPCPILIQRGGEEVWPPERVVIGDDGSYASCRAEDLAAHHIGGLVGARGFLVRSDPRLPEIYEEERKMDARLVNDELRRAEKSLMKRAAEIESLIGTHSRVRVAAGDAARILLETAEEGVACKTLVAEGSSGLSPMRRMRLGSVSSRRCYEL